MKKIGLTTTVPIEVLIAAGYEPVDLNNLFITSKHYSKYIEIAEREGFPKSMCAWIKGIYGACIHNNIEEIVGVMEGDCSNTKVLLEVLNLKKMKTHPFSYPVTHKKEDVQNEIMKFMNIFGVSVEEVENVRQRLNKIRKLAIEIDRMTYIENKIYGFENHLYQVSLSDLNVNINKFEQDLRNFIAKAKIRSPIERKLRLGYIGVPPMTADLYDFVEEHDSRIVFNEVQREFAFPRADKAKDIFEQYYDYTYPYDIKFRLIDLNNQIKQRQLDGIIHYTQSFCHRSVEHIILKQKLDIPILNIEGDRTNYLDARTKLRLEAFLDMLIDLKEEAKCKF